MDDLAHEPRALHLASMRLSPNPREARPLVLVIDQFEEIFTLAQDEAERQAFISNLLTAASEPGGMVTVVITLRADFYSHCAPYPELRDALASLQEYIGLMDSAELHRAITEPASQGGWQLEPGLLEVLLKDAGAEVSPQPEPGFLPLLSHALLETWQRRSGRSLTVSGYLASGGVRGAIADTADTVYEDELDEPQRLIARNIFLRLVQVGEEEGGMDTRRRVPFDELVRSPDEVSLVQDVLNRLVEARLIVTTQEGVELAHEALIREWPTLRNWLDDDREGLLLHRHMTQAAASWERRDRDPAELYRGARLAQVMAWVQSHPSELSELEIGFLAASSDNAAREEAERETQRQHELEMARALAETQRLTAARLRRRALYLAGAFVLALILGGLALFQGNLARRSAEIAQEERRLSYARELAAASLSNQEVDPERSILLALQAVAVTRVVDGTVLPEAEEALHKALLASPVRQTFTGHEGWVLSIAYSPDGTRLASIEDDGTTIIWDAASGEELHRLPGITEPGDAIGNQRIAYSPDGTRLVTGDGSMVKVWDARSGSLLLELPGHTADVWAVGFSPGGELLASGGMDAAVRIWDSATGALLHEMTGHQAPVESLAFHPDGQHLVTAGDDFSLKVWDVQTGEMVDERADFSAEIYGVAFSPDGQRLAAGNTDGIFVWEMNDLQGEPVLRVPGDIGAGLNFSPDGSRLAAITGSLANIWDAQTGQELLTLAGHTGWLGGLAFSPDGQRLASSSFDGTVKLWSLALGQEETTLAGPGTRAIYSPDGAQIATAGLGGTVQLWNAATGEEVRTLVGHTAQVMSVAFSADGRQVVSGGFDETAKIWNANTGELLHTLTGHELAVRDVAFSPDGRRIATGGFDETARLWDAETGEELQRLAGHEGLVLGVAFSPDSARLTTSSTDGTAKLWDAATGELLLTLTGTQDGIRDITFSPDGRWLATGGGDGSAQIWNAASGKELQTLSGHTAGIMSVAFSADGRLLASGSDDNTAKVWDTDTGEELHTLPGNQGGVWSVSFNPRTEGRLAVGSPDGVVRVFLLDIDDLLAFARTRVTRPLSAWECQKFLHLPECPPAVED
jgi:WD40 repeat protein